MIALAKYNVLWLYRELNEQGCNVSISEVQDAVEMLDLFDESATPSDYKKVLYATLGKTPVCRAAIDNIITYHNIKQQISKEIRFGGEEQRSGSSSSIRNAKRLERPTSTIQKGSTHRKGSTGGKSGTTAERASTKKGAQKNRTEESTHEHGKGGNIGTQPHTSRTTHHNMGTSSNRQGNVEPFGHQGWEMSAHKQQRGSGFHPHSDVCKIDKAFSGGILKCKTERGMEPIFASKDLDKLHRLKSLIEQNYSSLKEAAKDIDMSLKYLLKDYATTVEETNMDDATAKAYSNILEQLGKRYANAHNTLIKQQVRRLFDEFMARIDTARRYKGQISKQDLEKYLEESKKRVLELSRHELNKNMETLRMLEPDKSLVQQIERIFQRLRVKKANTISLHRSKTVNIRKTAKYAMKTGVPMYIYYSKKKPRKVDFYVLADVSGSMSEKLPYVLATVEAARKVLGRTGKVYTFVDRIYSLDNTPLGGYTDFGGILKDISKYIPDRSVPVILFTDVRRGYGESPARVIEELRKRGYKVYVLDPEDLHEAMTGDSEFQYLPRGISYTVPTPQDLAQAVAEILQEEGA